ncbi:hypothetical protein HDU98_011093 [Podochytrium sp. JEL0797]|nr:hypothetical protein HDU98_011093 [Podochytrium sp. JEL0797]
MAADLVLPTNAVAPTPADIPKRNPTKKTFLERIIPQQTEDMTVKWARYSLAAILLVTFLCAACETWIMIDESTVNEHFNTASQNALQNGSFNISTIDSANQNFLVGTTYHSVFLASVVFWLIVTWDALLNQNIMQCVSINFYNLGLFVYSILQIVQTANDFKFVDSVPGMQAENSGYFLAAQILLPVLIGPFIPAFAYLTYRMHLEFGWRQYRITGGNIELERVFFGYHILLLLIKFSLFFVYAFSAIDLALTTVTPDGQIVIQISGLLVGAIVTFTGFHGARHEKRPLSIIYILGNLCILAYIIERVWTANARSSSGDSYSRARLPFLMYAVVGGFLVMGSCVYGALVMVNFGKGLKEVLDQEKKRKEGESAPQEIDLDA